MPPAPSLQHGQDLVQRLLDLGHARHRRIRRRMPDRHDHHRLFRRWAVQKFVQELHRIWRVCQNRQPGVMQGRDQKTGGDADAFGDIVILESGAVIQLSPALRENDDQPGRDIEMRLAGVGADRFQRLQPFLAAAAIVELLFLGLRGLLGTDLGLVARCLASGCAIATKGPG